MDKATIRKTFTDVLGDWGVIVMAVGLLLFVFFTPLGVQRRELRNNFLRGAWKTEGVVGKVEYRHRARRLIIYFKDLDGRTQETIVSLPYWRPRYVEGSKISLMYNGSEARAEGSIYPEVPLFILLGFCGGAMSVISYFLRRQLIRQLLALREGTGSPVKGLAENAAEAKQVLAEVGYGLSRNSSLPYKCTACGAALSAYQRKCHRCFTKTSSSGRSNCVRTEPQQGRGGGRG